MADRGRGRPTLYTNELAAEICARLSEGETLADICRSDGMPAYRTVADWRKAHAAFSAEFGHARDAGFDSIASRTRNTARGKTVAEGGDSTADVQRDALIINTDLKLLAKWDPRRYGDRVEIEHSGSIQTLPEDQLEARLAKLLGKAGVAGAAGGEAAADGEE